MDADTPTQQDRAKAYRRFWSACLAVALAVVTYFGFDAFVAYTDDAYIRSDLIRIAPEVSGPVLGVHVEDNARVEAQALLVTLDPEPFALAVAQKKDEVASAEANVAVKLEAEAEQTARVETAQAALDLAQTDFQRIDTLVTRGDEAQATLDRTRETLRTAQGVLALAKARTIVGQRETEQAKRVVQAAQAALDIATYQLSRTKLQAGAAGYVNNLTVRPGRYATAGEPLIGLVDDTQWRVIANFKEDVAASVSVGQEVWVWLDTRPWRFWRGRVSGVARGIARQDEPDRLLPYVAPTTDWIRLRRRFPVTVLLDEPLPRDALFMGADARVLFFR